jgi:hypothetical protein
MESKALSVLVALILVIFCGATLRGHSGANSAQASSEPQTTDTHAVKLTTVYIGDFELRAIASQQNASQDSSGSATRRL